MHLDHRLTSGFLVLVCAFPSATALANGVRIVDQPALGVFQSLQGAVDAAADGDVLLVGKGTYAAFTIDGKGLSVIAPGSDATITGTIEVKNLASTKRVLLSGLDATGTTAQPIATPGLRLTNDAGHVRLQDCAFIGGKGVNGGGQQGYGSGGHGVQILTCPTVAFVGCSLMGGKGYSDSTGSCYDCYGGNGGDGVIATTAGVALYDCQLVGGNGGDEGGQGGNGGTGYRAPDWGFFASGCAFTGGSGGDGEDYIVAYGGNGGDGIYVGAAQAQLLDNSYLAGPGGESYICSTCDGLPGQQIAGPGFVNLMPGARRKLTAPAFTSDQSSIQLTLLGQPGDKFFLRTSRSPFYLLAKPLHGVWLVPQPGFGTFAPTGVVPPSGTLVLQVPIADLVAPTNQALLYLQGFCMDSMGRVYLTSALHVQVLNRAAAPDCNGNAVNDILDTFEALAPDCDHDLMPDACDPDCNGNGIPDGCDFQSGFSHDCNGNFVPDSCDIASGYSLDTNANQIPDECEFPGTWYVDPAAPPGGNGTFAAPFRSLRAGIARGIGKPGETVVALDGLYTGPDNTNLDLAGKAMIVDSLNGPAACVIDCQNTARAFRFHTGEKLTTRVSGFTIQNGRAFGASPSGGAILMEKTSPTIAGCIFVNCTAERDGGAIAVLNFGSFSPAPKVLACTFTGNSTPAASPATRGGALFSDFTVLVSKCDFTHNTSDLGGAVYAQASTNQMYIRHSRLIENTARQDGGAVWTWCNGAAGFSLDDCLVAGNVAGNRGGAVFADNQYSNLTAQFGITDCTIVDNTASGAGGGGVCITRLSIFRLDNSILWHNTASTGAQLSIEGSNNTVNVRYDLIEGGLAAVYHPLSNPAWGAGNLDLDPQFVDADGADNNPLTFGDNDYHLSLASPAIDAANNSLVPQDATDIDADGNVSELVPLDFDLQPRFVDVLSVPNTGSGTVDMGTFEHAP